MPSAVLVELYRGGGTDEAIDRELGRGYARVVTTGIRIARIAGHLLAEHVRVRVVVGERRVLNSQAPREG